MKGKRLFEYFIFAMLIDLIKASVMNFDVSPSELKTNLTDSVSMRCCVIDSGSSNEDVRRVVSLLVTHNDQDVASVTAVDAPQTFTTGDSLQAKGSISGVSGEGTLELTWADASRASLGEYVCEAAAIDGRGHSVTLKGSLELVSVEPSLGDVISVFKTQLTAQSQEIQALKQQNSNLQNQNQQIQVLKQEHVAQEQLIRNLTSTITHLKECTSKRVAFTTALKENQVHKFAAGQIVKYEKIVLNDGNSYDITTGKFTCPVSGLYSFEVYVLSGDNKYACPTIYLNSREISSPHARNDELDASSTGVSLHLNQGDFVTIKEKCSPAGYFQGSGGNWGYQPNIFTGRLIHADACL